MEILPHDAVDVGRTLVDAREKKTRRLLHLVITAALFYGAMHTQELGAHFDEQIPRAIEVVFSVVLGIALLFSLRAAWRVSSDDAHMFWADRERMAIRLRSWLTSGFDPEDPTVAVIPFSEIESVRRVRDAILVAHSDSAMRYSRDVLEFTPKSREIAERLRDAIRTEATRKSTRLAVQTPDHRPVEITPDGRIRVVFKGPSSVLTPTTLQALDQLSVVLRVEDEVDLRALSKAEQKDAPEFFEPQLQDAIESGDTLRAIKLARVVYGVGLKEAKEWVEAEMSGRDSSRASSPRGSSASHATPPTRERIDSL